LADLLELLKTSGIRGYVVAYKLE